MLKRTCNGNECLKRKNISFFDCNLYLNLSGIVRFLLNNLTDVSTMIWYFFINDFLNCFTNWTICRDEENCFFANNSYNELYMLVDKFNTVHVYTCSNGRRLKYDGFYWNCTFNDPRVSEFIACEVHVLRIAKLLLFSFAWVLVNLCNINSFN